MADDDSTQTKVDKPGQNGQAEELNQEELISVEDLDKIIQESDPEFNQSLLQVMSVLPSSGQNIDLLDLDQILKEEESQSPRARWNRFQRRIYANMSMAVVAIKSFLQKGWKAGLLSFLNMIKEIFTKFSKSIANAQTKFKYLSVQKKLVIVGMTLLSIFVVLFVRRSLTVGVIPKDNQLFVNSMEEWAKEVSTYPQDEVLEDFYDSPRVKQNIMSMRRAVVNLKRSETSGPNPMAFFEFFAEGNSSDVVIELKDREYEVIDHVQRAMEEMTFNELDTIAGKQLLLEKIRKELNSFLTKGKVKKVYIKQAIVKP